MVRKIFLLRHGDAIFPEQGMDDFDRPLNSRGTNKIRDLGGRMLEKGVLPQLVFCSPALRTKQTIKQLSESLKQDMEVEYFSDIYEASVNTLFKLLCATDATIERVMIVGHNPGLTYLAEYLTGQDVGVLEPADLLVLDYAAGGWKELSSGLCSFNRI